MIYLWGREVCTRVERPGKVTLNLRGNAQVMHRTVHQQVAKMWQ